ncbi:MULTISPECIES: flagellar hook-associated protein FlgK [Pseudomonas]|jgi:flagellar hook-associated protein 1 FlgK|uniref:Flagellar hook-associated protein 1 n=3 Tax=Pseudomonas fluorescens group TaxID=136843 RepID=A0AB36CRS1_9PSED|nr:MULTISPECIES: flagellar hook-associated protein FlgK [Pseudomonas]MDF9879609.1 flagellar hook-associated protein 1 FlgK [Pseudomonas silensiensis]AHZ72202.1 flagellar hook-associated protein FlgK [Pseudomonas mandelii JR-1]MSU93468.1 flagellar hook-associated protein FlgK [Pseudomonas mandelii]NMZ78669.1 flagellar hook-associated protein FlgK [Pseudomonas mandelii]OOL37157.1 flagellar hook-associated protein FlgK [Pseudomonas sp. FSL W5-0299]
MSLLNIGMSGLAASQSSLMTTGNNIANADTAGYSRQQTVQGTKASNQFGNVYIGTGTTLADVRRVYNSYLDAQLQTTTSLNSDAAAYAGQISPLDALLSDSGTGLNGALTKFFASVQNVNAKPGDDASRQLLLSDAQALSNRFNSISSQLTQQNANVNGNLANMADQVNKLAATVAQLNQKISEISKSGGMPNELLDARNETVRQLSTFTGAQVIERDGNLDVYLGSGQPLVIGGTASTLSVASSLNDPSRMGIQLNRAGSTVDITSVMTGGEMGGLLRYRSTVLDPAMNELGRVALVVADQMNSLQAQGIDKNGAFGSNLFNSINSAAQMASRSVATVGNSAGSGNFDVSIEDSGKLTINDYKVTFTSGTNYTVSRLPDGTSMGAFSTLTTPPPVIDGFSLKLSGGTAAAGDTFKITPTRNAAANIKTEMTDSKRLAIAAPLSASIAPGGSGTLTIPASGQPTLTTQFDIYDSATTLAIQNGLQNSTPVKVVFGAGGGTTQTYQLLDAKGNALSSGTIVPGQNNTLSLSIPLVDASGAAIMDPGPPAVQRTATFDMTVAGSPGQGSAINVTLSQPGTLDNRNGTALAGLQTKQTVDTGSASKGISLTDAYGKLVEGVGAKAAQGKLDSAATTAILANAKGARDSLSGVDLDEETGNLVKYQQYYTASSQIIKAAQEIFSTLINSL